MVVSLFSCQHPGWWVRWKRVGFSSVVALPNPGYFQVIQRGIEV